MASIFTLFLVFFFIPTSFPFFFSGPPFLTWGQTASLWVIFSFIIFYLLKTILGLAHDHSDQHIQSEKTPNRIRLLILILVTFLIGIKSIYPVNSGMPVCITLPQLGNNCIFSSENIFLYSPLSVTRYDYLLSYNSSEYDNKWRIGEFNTLNFNHYVSDNLNNPTTSAWINARKNNNYPFIARITLDKKTQKNIEKFIGSDTLTLKLTYSGSLNILKGVDNVVAWSFPGFYSESQSQIIDINNIYKGDIVFRYQNFFCTTESCLIPQETQSIPVNLSVLKIEVKDSHGKYIPISSALTIPPLLLWFGKVGEALLISVLCLLWISAVKLRFGKLSNPFPIADAIVALIISLISFVGVYTLYLRGYVFSPPKTYIALIPMWITAAILLVYSSRARNLLTKISVSFISRLIPVLLLITLLIVPLYLRKVFWFQTQLTLYPPGDDQLTYYSWAREVLNHKTVFLEPTLSLSKPFFIYIRAIAVWLFGDLNTTLDTYTYWCFMSLPVLLVALLGVILVRKYSDYLNPTLNIKIIITALMFAIPLWFIYFQSGGWAGTFGSALSEGPSWFLAMISLFLTLSIFMVKKKNLSKLIMLSGTFMGLSVLLRTPVLSLIPSYSTFIITITAYVFPGIAVKRLAKLALLSVTPCLIAILIIMIHAQIGQFNTNQLISYFSAGTSIGYNSSPLQAISLTKLVRYFPTFLEIALMGTFFTSLFLTVRHLKYASLFVLMLILSNFLFQIPFIGTPYYPRGLFMNYAQLSVFSIGFALIYLRETSKTEGKVGGKM